MAIERIDLDQDPIWDIQFDETVTQYRAFCLYRDMLETRALVRVADVWARDPQTDEERTSKKKVPQRLQQWSARNRWVERAEAYDLYLERKRREAREGDIARMERREKLLGETIVSGLLRRVLGHVDEENPAATVEAIDWSKLTPQEVAALGRFGVETSRLATNRPTSLIRGALVISTTEFIQATSDLTEILFRHIPDERKPIAAEEIRAYSSGERRMLTAG